MMKPLVLTVVFVYVLCSHISYAPPPYSINNHTLESTSKPSDDNQEKFNWELFGTVIGSIAGAGTALAGTAAAVIKVCRSCKKDKGNQNMLHYTL